jgi:hypothetical protein
MAGPPVELRYGSWPLYCHSPLSTPSELARRDVNGSQAIRRLQLSAIFRIRTSFFAEAASLQKLPRAPKVGKSGRWEAPATKLASRQSAARRDRKSDSASRHSALLGSGLGPSKDALKLPPSNRNRNAAVSASTSLSLKLSKVDKWSFSAMSTSNKLRLPRSFHCT